MTNFERWRNYMSWCISPDNYINWGFYGLISAALQRRVWLGPTHKPLFLNIYAILTGETGVGKGLVLTEIYSFLSYHKLDPNAYRNNVNLSKIDDQVVKDTINKVYIEDFQAAEQMMKAREKDNTRNFADKPLLLPIGVDSTTYQSLVSSMPKAMRRKDYLELDPASGKYIPKIYTHTSMAFCLEEISSLFRKKTEDIVNFLIKVYDCQDYTYETISRGFDRIRKPCLTFIGGTTPHFMQEVFDDALLNEGFSSRTFFIFAARNRFRTTRIRELSDEQKQYKVELLQHIKKLTELYGPVTFTEEADNYLEDWWVNKAETTRANFNMKLNSYYGRKQIHTMKLAAILHFMESTEMTIGVECVKKAIEVLDEEERRMHYCLGLDDTNPLSKPAKKILKFLQMQKNVGYMKKELLAEFWDQMPDPENDITLILDRWINTGAIDKYPKEHPITKKQEVYYKAAMGATML